MVKHLKITVSGRVQGVAYRQSTLEKAMILGLRGSVQNLPDGSVEIHVEGPDNRLDEFLKWCSKGPNNAFVENISSVKLPLENYPNFRII